MIGVISYFIFLLLAGLTCAAFMAGLGKIRSYLPLMCTAFSVNFILRAYLILTNEGVDIFADKFAGEVSLDIYNIIINGQTGSINQTFFPQMLLNFLGFSLFSPERLTIVLTNAFLVSLTGILAFAYLVRIYTPTTGWYGLISTYGYLGALNFSIFGLRDPIILFFTLLYLLSFLYLLKMKRDTFWILNLNLFLCSSLVILWSRPELLPTIAFLPSFYTLYSLLKRTHRIANFPRRLLSQMMILSFFGVILIGSGLFAYRIVLANIGITSLVSPLEIAGTYADARYNRQFNDWGGSNGGGGAILPPSVYNALPPSLRIPVQALGIIALPFPWLINSIEEVLAFADSLYIIFGLLITITILHKVKLENRHEALALLLTFFWGIIVMGFIVNNAGNAFRLRLSVFPYLAIAFSIVLAESHLTRRKTSSVLFTPKSESPVRAL